MDTTQNSFRSLYEEIEKNVKIYNLLKGFANAIAGIGIILSFAFMAYRYFFLDLKSIYNFEDKPWLEEHYVVFLTTIIIVIIIVRYLIVSHLSTLKNNKASEIAENFFIEQTRLFLKKFFQESGVIYSENDIDNLVRHKDNEPFAEFNSRGLELYFHLCLLDQFSFHGLKMINGEEIVIKKILIEESQNKGIFAVHYKQFFPPKNEEGIVAQKKEYYNTLIP